MDNELNNKNAKNNNIKKIILDQPPIDLQTLSKNRYTENCKGPFIVYIVNSRPEENLGNYHDILFAKCIYQVFKNCIKISKKDEKKI